MIDKALPFHLPVQDVLQLGRDPVATASSFTFGPHLVPVGRVRCLGTIVSIGSGAAASTPGAAGGGAAEAGAALQPGDDSISDGIAGNENEHTGSDVGGAVAVELVQAQMAVEGDACHERQRGMHGNLSDRPGCATILMDGNIGTYDVHT